MKAGRLIKVALLSGARLKIRSKPTRVVASFASWTAVNFAVTRRAQFLAQHRKWFIVIYKFLSCNWHFNITKNISLCRTGPMRNFMNLILAFTQHRRTGPHTRNLKFVCFLFQNGVRVWRCSCTVKMFARSEYDFWMKPHSVQTESQKMWLGSWQLTAAQDFLPRNHDTKWPKNICGSCVPSPQQSDVSADTSEKIPNLERSKIL